MTPPAQPVRQVAAVALLGIVLAGLFVLVLPIAGRISGLREEITNERLALGRFMVMAALENRVADTQLAARVADESDAYLKGASDPLRAAGLQTLVSQLAATNGVRLTSGRALPQRDSEHLRLIGARVEFNAGIEQLRAMLHAIESARPFLFVEALQVRPVSALSERDLEHGGLLDVRLDIYGALPRRKG